MYNLLILEPAIIVQYGLRSVAETWEFPVRITTYTSMEELIGSRGRQQFHLAFVNPAVLGSTSKSIARLQQELDGIPIIGLFVTAYDRSACEQFQAFISLTDPERKIHGIMSRCLNAPGEEMAPVHGLTERETDVLKLLVQGKSNKEMAGQLFISTHTVISHRKNINAKLGIKTPAALAIYAVANHLIEIEDSPAGS